MSGKSGARRRALRRVARLVQPYADKVKRLIGA
jgi:hypothetical protein